MAPLVPQDLMASRDKPDHKESVDPLDPQELPGPREREDHPEVLVHLACGKIFGLTLLCRSLITYADVCKFVYIRRQSLPLSDTN